MSFVLKFASLFRILLGGAGIEPATLEQIAELFYEKVLEN